MASRKSIQVSPSKREAIQEASPTQPVIHLNSMPVTTVTAKQTRWAFPLLVFVAAFTLFLLAYAGPDIGNVLGYLVIPALGLFPGLLVGERFGKVAGVLAGLLLVTVLTPAYGNTIIASSVSMFTSLQQISQGILVFLGSLFFLGSLLLIVLQKTNRTA